MAKKMWTRGSDPAGPTVPPDVPADVPPDSAAVVPPHTRVFQRMAELLPDATRHPKANEFKCHMQAQDYAAEFAESYARGVGAGCVRALTDWLAALQQDMEMLPDERRTLDKISGSELIGGETQPDRQRPGHEPREAIATPALLGPLQMLAMITANRDLDQMLDDVGLLVEDVAAAIARADPEWIDEFFSQNGNASAQGVMAGESYGRALLERIRIFIDTEY